MQPGCIVLCLYYRGGGCGVFAAGSSAEGGFGPSEGPWSPGEGLWEGDRIPGGTSRKSDHMGGWKQCVPVPLEEAGGAKPGAGEKEPHREVKSSKESHGACEDGGIFPLRQRGSDEVYLLAENQYGKAENHGGVCGRIPGPVEK